MSKYLVFAKLTLSYYEPAHVSTRPNTITSAQGTNLIGHPAKGYLVPKYNCCSYSGFYTILRTPSSFRQLQETAMMFECPDCSSTCAFYSRRRGVTEKYLLPFLLLRPYRCADCFQRCYRTIFISAREARQRKSAASGSGPTTQGRHVA